MGLRCGLRGAAFIKVIGCGGVASELDPQEIMGLKWSGPKDPYITYELSTIKKGAYADLLLWNGNPMDDIKLILDEDKLDFVMKDGLVYKNTIVEGDHPISPCESS